MCIELANKTTKIPVGVAENVLVKVGKFILPIDFVILDMKEDEGMPILFGRPFLATAHALIDVHDRKISIKVNGEKLIFDLEKSMKYAAFADDDMDDSDQLESIYQSFDEEITSHDPADSVNLTTLVDYTSESEEELEEERDKIEETSFVYLASSTENSDKTPTLKELPSHLEYAFLDERPEHPVIISSLLSQDEKARLLQVLSEHKGAIAWKVSDIKGISPSFCSHKILMEEDFKPVVQPR